MCVDICKLVVEEIKRSNIRIFVLSKKSGVSEGTIRKWLKGKSVPNIENASAVLEVLGKELYVRGLESNNGNT